ncbi:TrmH family RNA methyltransferase [Actinomycetospora cinnamomea]|uniref:tRNA G18 (Ribose-2'-O)-methylase SpoU n=1 Tax=Actinomycetospora cinnamomea TaxID=663609 RepID=A0A2U1FM05_9PSEU|nr:RNA methyltransferase [Actinomycetospora cinnamomea]PVZ13215.1 tRNA G18 (ribose-2'-O)-methylase SpoU [Actinomycetospora cinnamomea]
MARVVAVDDAADPRLADFRDLARADRRPDRPGGRGLVLAEGTVVVRRLLASPYPPRALLGVARRIEDLAPDLRGADVPADLTAYVTDADTMAHVVGFHLNRGVLASADRAPSPEPAALLAGARRVALLEGVNDHENLGALFRNAAALGVDAVLVGTGCADPLYRRSVRVSMGHVLRVPFAACGLGPAVTALRHAGFTLAALTPGGDPSALAALASHERLALVLGAEGPGLSDEALAAADVRVRIPMADDVDSLNVATAAAVAFHATGVPR